LSVAYYFSACCLHIKNRSAGCSQGRKTDYNRDCGSAKKCDVLILTGNFERSSDIYYDKDFRLCVVGSHPMDEDAGAIILKLLAGGYNSSGIIV
jgi:hypothetical protein